MNIYDATEQAFKNGYEQGCKDALNEILDNYNKFIMSIPNLVQVIAQQLNVNI